MFAFSCQCYHCTRLNVSILTLMGNMIWLAALRQQSHRWCRQQVNQYVCSRFHWTFVWWSRTKLILAKTHSNEIRYFTRLSVNFLRSCHWLINENMSPNVLYAVLVVKNNFLLPEPHGTHKVALICVSVVLSQTPAYTTCPWILG